MSNSLLSVSLYSLVARKLHIEPRITWQLTHHHPYLLYGYSKMLFSGVCATVVHQCVCARAAQASSHAFILASNLLTTQQDISVIVYRIRHKSSMSSRLDRPRLTGYCFPTLEDCTLYVGCNTESGVAVYSIAKHKRGSVGGISGPTHA
eukprot:37712-Eustigmatos_ZCMA.PRE.1